MGWHLQGDGVLQGLGYPNIGFSASLLLVLKLPWEGITPGGCHSPGRVSQPQEGVTALESRSGRREARNPSSPDSFSLGNP